MFCLKFLPIEITGHNSHRLELVTLRREWEKVLFRNISVFCCFVCPYGKKFHSSDIIFSQNICSFAVSDNVINNVTLAL